MAAYNVDVWIPFAAAVVGAAAVLVGLIFVALSINLDALLLEPPLLRRAGAAIVLLLSVVMATLVLLVPGQATWILGLELVAVGAAGAVVVGLLLARQLGHMEEAYRGHFRRALGWSWAVQVCYALCGASLVLGTGGGLYWLLPACVTGLCRSILESWVLLVEIKR
jgi:hypothetical protein